VVSPAAVAAPAGKGSEAAETGCLFAIDTDAHAPGQLDWLVNGTVRAKRAGITADRVVNTRGADEIAGTP